MKEKWGTDFPISVHKKTGLFLAAISVHKKTGLFLAINKNTQYMIQVCKVIA
jgi:hypothetical protein